MLSVVLFARAFASDPALPEFGEEVTPLPAIAWHEVRTAEELVKINEAALRGCFRPPEGGASGIRRGRVTLLVNEDGTIAQTLLVDPPEGWQYLRPISLMCAKDLFDGYKLPENAEGPWVETTTIIIAFRQEVVAKQ